jgi:hypothetical protein
MSKCPAKKAVKPVDAVKTLRRALAKRGKAELVEALVELAAADRQVFRQLDSRFELESPPRELVAATRQAIADATAFDKRDINRNFDYDYAAYAAVKRNLHRLAESGQLRSAMELSLTLMERGSHQVEMSDEGLMTEDIEECLTVVAAALKDSGLPAAEILAWCAQMTRADSVGFIGEKELQTLRNSLQRSRPA